MRPRLLSVSVEEVTPGTAAGTHVRELAAALQASGAIVEIVAPPTGEAAAPGIPRRLWRVATTLRRAAARLPGQEVLYLRAHPLLWPLVRLARARGVPVVQEVNGRESDIFLTHAWARPFAGALRALQRAQYREADAIAAVTPGLAEWVRSLGARGLVGVVPNGVNTDMFVPGAPRPAEAPAGRYAVFFGGFHPWHGIGNMLDAVRHPEWPDSVSLLCIGEGREAELVDAAAAEPALAQRVRRLGRRDHRALASLVAPALASLVVIENRAGKAETGLAPLKLFESMACGVPVVVSAEPGMAALVRQAGCGLVVPEADPAALARAVASLAGDPDGAARMGRAARAEAVAAQSWEARARDLLALMRPILSAGRAQAT